MLDPNKGVPLNRPNYTNKVIPKEKLPKCRENLNFQLG